MKLLRSLCLAVMLVSTLSLAACNTVKGVGKDVEGAGKGVQKGATDVQTEIKK